MGIMKQALDTSIHKRQISLATYPADNHCIIVEGVLMDDRTVDVYTATGEKKPPGTIHHMVIRMLVGPPGLTIQAVEVEMLQHPRVECTDTMQSLELLKGLQIKSGYSAKVNNLIGGNKGCAHLTTLVNSMAQEVVQGYYSFFAQIPPESAGKDKKQGVSEFIADTCHVWRKDGPLMQKLGSG